MPRLPGGAGRLRQRVARLWAVQAEPGGRLRSVGATGPRALGRTDRRAHFFPRHGEDLSALRPAAPPRLVALPRARRSRSRQPAPGPRPSIRAGTRTFLPPGGGGRPDGPWTRGGPAAT